jgi:histone H3/H4
MARKKTTAKKAIGGRDTFVVASKVKSYVRSKELMASSELADALSRRVQGLLDDAIARCNGNGRRTVRPVDL